MYKVRCDHLEFVGDESDCWKFVIGFLGYDMRGDFVYDIMDFDEKWCPVGTITIEVYDE